MNSAALANKAMQVRLSISQWSARKYDRKVSSEVASKYNTDNDAGRYNKVLIAKDAIVKIQKIANAARDFHYQNTLPWDDIGSRILTAKNYDDYLSRMREFRSQFEVEVNAFCQGYPEFVEDARRKLNGLFNQGDYPHVQEIRRKFDFQIVIDPLPVSGDFRVTLQGNEIEKIRKEIEERVKAAQALAVKDLWKRVYDCVEHISERLGKPDAIFRDTLIENAIELCSLLPKLNFANDQRLENMRKEIEGKLCKHTPEVLRSDSDARSKTAEDADKILKTMAGYLGR